MFAPFIAGVTGPEDEDDAHLPEVVPIGSLSKHAIEAAEAEIQADEQKEP